MAGIGHIEDVQTVPPSTGTLLHSNEEIISAIDPSDHDIFVRLTIVRSGDRNELRIRWIVDVDDVDPGARASSRPRADVGVRAEAITVVIYGDVAVHLILQQALMPEDLEILRDCWSYWAC
jgi:hypothetical protein